VSDVAWVALAWLPVGLLLIAVGIVWLRQRARIVIRDPMRAQAAVRVMAPECRVRGCKAPPEWHYRVDLVSPSTDGQGIRCVFGLDVCSTHSFALKAAVRSRRLKLAIDLEKARPYTDRRPAA